jgi:DNA-binding response OmpR family regulator
MPPQAPPTAPTPPPASQPKILLIEDEDYIRDLYKRQLDQAGLHTDAFATGQEGLSAVAANHYDLILLDIMLPDTNGLQILKEVKQNPATKATTVVLLTNLGQDVIIKEGFELGAEGYLIKASLTPNQVVQEVKNALAKKQASAPSA